MFAEVSDADAASSLREAVNAGLANQDAANGVTSGGAVVSSTAESHTGAESGRETDIATGTGTRGGSGGGGGNLSIAAIMARSLVPSSDLRVLVDALLAHLGDLEETDPSKEQFIRLLHAIVDRSQWYDELGAYHATAIAEAVSAVFVSVEEEPPVQVR